MRKLASRSGLLTIAVTSFFSANTALAQEVQAGAVPDVSVAEQTLANIKVENAKRLQDAEAALQNAKVAKAKADIEAAAVANAKAAESERYLASISKPVATPPVGGGQGAKDDKDKTENEAGDGGYKTDFGGIKFGVGMSLTVDIGSSDRVLKASVVNGVVRADKTDNSKARIMLESHYFFSPERRFLGLDPNMWGIGPFLAIRPGSEEIIDAIAFGLMLGLRREEKSQSSFNIGIGLVIDPSVQILGEGIKLNQPLPVGEPDVRFRETSQKGILGIVSFSF